MGIFDKLFNQVKVQPENYFKVTLTNQWISVEHPKHPTEAVKWNDVHTILMVNTDEGPSLPDVWLTIIGKHGHCRIPQGAKGFEAVYDVVSKNKGFDFENFIKSMRCTDNAEFLLWSNEISVQH